MTLVPECYTNTVQIRMWSWAYSILVIHHERVIVRPSRSAIRSIWDGRHT